jgi:Leucine-rich repeat (LRR) protein
MRIKILLLLVAVSFLAYPFKLKAQAVNVQDSLALVDLYDSTNGPGWTNHNGWLTVASVVTWYGVTVEDGRVKSIAMRQNKVTGTLPSSLRNLSALRNIDFLLNNLGGEIPSVLGNITTLDSIYLGGNSFSGTIPASFSNLVNLEHLNLNTNQLSGNIPEFLGDLHNLNYLGLYSNHFTGNIPASLGKLANLNVLYLQLNQLDGTIPASLDTLHKLTVLDISHNNFTFSGMEAIAGNYRFAVYSPQTNIPVTRKGNKIFVSVGGMPQNDIYKFFVNSVLVSTQIGDSSFTIDPAIGGDYFVSVSNNIAKSLTLTGTLSLINIQDSLTLVDLYNNINGPLWAKKDNWLTPSPLKTWFGVIRIQGGRVVDLELSENGLTGTIPPSIGNLSALNFLVLNQNNLSGSIPAQVGNLSNIRSLYLAYNQLTGSIPSALGNLSTATDIEIEANQLTGNIPASLGNIPNLSFLALNNNQLSGPIPPELGNIRTLQNLFLFNNNLSGTIPSSFGNLVNLGMADLSVNLLSGTIPSSLKNLTKLSFLYIYNNHFTFEGLEGITGYPFITIAYPQATLPLIKTINTLSVSAGGTPTNDTFRLYKNNVLQKTQIADSVFTIGSAGNNAYSITITNATFTENGLFSLRSEISLQRSDTTILPAVPLNVQASYEYTDNNGWTNYYWDHSTPDNLADDILLLSLKKNGQDIGNVGQRTCMVRLAATTGAGSNTAIKLTNPLITNTSGYWVMNRYWQVTPLREPLTSVGVRFYYNNQDLADINGSYPTHNLTNDKLIFFKTVGGNPDPTTNLAGATQIISILPGT